MRSANTVDHQSHWERGSNTSGICQDISKWANVWNIQFSPKFQMVTLYCALFARDNCSMHLTTAARTNRPTKFFLLCSLILISMPLYWQTYHPEDYKQYQYDLETAKTYEHPKVAFTESVQGVNVPPTNDFKTHSQRIFFDKYFHVLSRDGMKVVASCKHCKQRSPIHGDLRALSTFTRHLKVGILVALIWLFLKIL